MADFATPCVNDIIAKLKTISGFTDKVFSIYEQRELFSDSQGLTFPYMGVIYEGLFSDDVPGKKGLSANLICAILVADSGTGLGGDDSKVTATTLLDDARTVIRATRSPTGHIWNFIDEIPVDADEGVFAYLQRWETKAMLTQGTLL